MDGINKVVPISKHFRISLDLNEHEDLYRKLIDIAKKEMRSVNNQLIYWLYNNIDDYIGCEKGGKK